MVTFNYWFDGEFQRITLVEGEYKELHRGGQTEEGWSREDIVFLLDDGIVYMEVHTAGVDCDGRMETNSDYECPVSGLDRYITPDGTPTPNWNRRRASQRDYTAEAAGY